MRPCTGSVVCAQHAIEALVQGLVHLTGVGDVPPDLQGSGERQLTSGSAVGNKVAGSEAMALGCLSNHDTRRCTNDGVATPLSVATIDVHTCSDAKGWRGVPHCQVNLKRFEEVGARAYALASGDHPNIRTFVEQRNMKVDGFVRDRFADPFQ